MLVLEYSVLDLLPLHPRNRDAISQTQSTLVRLAMPRQTELMELPVDPSDLT